jgi:hypothetical protein
MESTANFGAQDGGESTEENEDEEDEGAQE